MFKVHNLSTPLLKKLPSLPKARSKRSNSSTAIALAVLNATPINVLQPNTPTEQQWVEYNLHPPPHGDTANHLHELTSQDVLPCSFIGFEGDFPKPFHSRYPDEKVFKAALELYNKQMESSHQGGSSRGAQRWECKGEVRASFQLCVLCKDIGKVRSESEKYYLDVMEVRKYRTILCKGCLGYILHKHVGSCLTRIEEKLREYKVETKDTK